jgi:FkbM family methyltransferase
MLDLNAALADFHAGGGHSREFAERFLGKDPSLRRYLLGRNQHALTCADWAPIDGIVDDFSPPDTTWHGYPVIRADGLPKDAIVVNCSMSISPVSAHKRLASVEGIAVVSYADLVRADPAFPLPDFVAAFRADYRDNGGKWRFLESLLAADDESSSVLSSLMLYRLTGDHSHMSQFSVRFRDQYFDSVVSLSESEVFIDCGGFDGDTVLEYCRRHPRYKHIYLFEPSPLNLDKARERVRGFENLSLIPLAVSDARGTLRFEPCAGSASAVSGSGSITINAVSMDDYILESVSYIKMDLEGWELQALKGARRHIVEDHPKLAISVYHAPSDFWRIPEYILGLRDDYKVYLRHYSEGWSESVLYFIPAA